MALILYTGYHYENKGTFDNPQYQNYSKNSNNPIIKFQMLNRITI